jgi:hypothetical protein
LFGYRTSDVDEIVGDHAEPDPTLHSIFAFVPAAIETVSLARLGGVQISEYRCGYVVLIAVTLQPPAAKVAAIALPMRPRPTDPIRPWIGPPPPAV